jgi:hypothetical protein
MSTNHPKHRCTPERRLQPPPNYFSRREQYRLMGLVFALLLVCFLIVQAAKPKNWQWLIGAEPPAGQIASRDVDMEVDTKLPEPLQPRRPLGEDVFASPANLQDDSERGAAGVERRETPAGDQLTPPRILASPATETRLPSPTAADYAAVQDDTVFQAAEAAAWYKLLAYLNNTTDEQLRAAAVGPVGFAQLHESPAAFRGRVIELAGDVWRAHYLEAPKNEFGIRGYWQCWLFPANSQNPIVVYALQLPVGFPQGMKLRERVEFMGVFFKRWAYASKSGSRVAPLVVAGRGRWHPAPEPTQRLLPGARHVATIVVACAAFAAAVAWLVNRLAQWNHPERLAAVPLTVDSDDDLKSVEEATEGFLGELEASDSHE